MGWLLSVYFLEQICWIQILSIFRIGFIFDIKNVSYGIFIGIWKLDFRFVIDKLSLPPIDKHIGAQS